MNGGSGKSRKVPRRRCRYDVVTMPTKRKRRPAEPAEAPSAKPIELVVRRGALWRFNTLKKKTADLPVTVLWDRRQSDRRTGSAAAGRERRESDRRKTPPFTWELADFVVVDQPSTPPGPQKPRKKKKS